MSQSSDDSKVILGSFSFHFDGGNYVEYSICTVPPIIGNDGFKLERRWVTDSKKESVNLGYYESVEAAVRFALEAWNQYILVGEMPTMKVTGSLDAEDLRNMMLEIQSPVEEPGDKIHALLDAIEVNPLDIALEAIVETYCALRSQYDAIGLTGELFETMENLESSLELIIELAYTEKEINPNE